MALSKHTRPLQSRPSPSVAACVPGIPARASGRTGEEGTYARQDLSRHSGAPRARDRRTHGAVGPAGGGGTRPGGPGAGPPRPRGPGPRGSSTARPSAPLDERATAASGGARHRLEPRWVGTVFGRVQIGRYRANRPGGASTPWTGPCGSPRPSPPLPGRETARSPRGLLAAGSGGGGQDSHQGGELVEAVFELGDSPRRPGPELVVVEAGGTHLRARRDEGDRFEMRARVLWRPSPRRAAPEPRPAAA